MTHRLTTSIIATSKCFAAYLAAAQINIENGLLLAQGLNDREAEREFQAILDNFVSTASDMSTLIDEANAGSELDAVGAMADYRYETRRDGDGL